MGNSHHELPDLQFDLRLDVLFAAVTEIARVLPAQDAVQVATCLRGQVMSLVGGTPLPELADEAMTAVLVPLLTALERSIDDQPAPRDQSYLKCAL